MELDTFIAERRRQKELLVMAHVVCGYPSFQDNWKELEIMEAAGVDLVELQFPFSEPTADGPLFVKANQLSLARGTHVTDCFEFMAKASKHFSFKVLMMGYYNTAFHMGHRAFIERLSAAGGVGFILPDLPLEESTELHAIAAEHDLAPIMLMTPTNSEQRLADIAAAARGFVYAVARKGVTGSATAMDTELAAFIERCHRATDLPVAVGFGISRHADLEFLKGKADIAIIGTAALKAFETGGAETLSAFFTDLISGEA